VNPETPSVQSVARALGLLDLVEAAGGSLSISAMAEQSALPVGTVHRLVQTLVAGGYLRQLADRRYCLGSRLVTLGTSANLLVGVHARPVLAALAEEFGETANLAVLSSGMAEYLAQVAGRHSMRTFTEVGHRVPLHCTGVGKAMLAMLPDIEAERALDQSGMVPVTATTITGTEAMLAELAAIRAQGYAVDEGEMEVGVRCVAVPIPGAPVMAVSISGPDVRVTPELVARAVPRLVDAAQQLSAVQVG
jgi:IclR family transcriptional regulator, acetate operon repressor